MSEQEELDRDREAVQHVINEGVLQNAFEVLRLRRLEGVLKDMAFNSTQGRHGDWYAMRARKALDALDASRKRSS